jgi:hypothetical protein
MLEGGQAGFGAVAEGDDDLLERHGGGVAGGEHTGHRGGAAGVDLDLAEAVSAMVSRSQSVFGNRPIWTKMPATSSRTRSPLARSV